MPNRSKKVLRRESEHVRVNIKLAKCHDAGIQIQMQSYFRSVSMNNQYTLYAQQRRYELPLPTGRGEQEQGTMERVRKPVRAASRLVF